VKGFPIANFSDFRNICKWVKCTKSVFLVNNNNDFKFASPEEPKGMRSRTEILGEALCILMVKTQPCAGSLQNLKFNLHFV